jgi:cytochrome b6-f complex iron-sulfur subunit
MKERGNKKIINTEVENTGRKEFLKRIWRILGFLALAELSVFFLSMLRPGRKDGKGSAAVFKIIGNVEDFSNNSVTTDRINKIQIVRTEDGGFLALSLICSHLGCSVLWDDFKDQFICPCHSSAFDKFGNVVNSPAPRPLDYFPVIIEAGKVKVDLSRKLKRKKFEKNQLTYAI